ncbi:MAG: hypothetical protein IKS72_05150, partial [Prevotella sp.]|nr:hypothetical protein [Prevotella sp.]
DLFYNNNLYDNKKLKDLTSGEIPQVDSLLPTNRTFIYGEDARNLFAGTTRVEKSNGAIYVTSDTLNMQPWLFWNPLINVEAEHYSSLANVGNGSTEVAKVSKDDQNWEVAGSVSNGSYLIGRPETSTSKVKLDFYLRDVRSTTYVIYGVFVPAHITNEYILEEDLKPNQVQVQLGMNNENGSWVKNLTTFYRTYVDESGKEKRTSNFTNNPNKIDTICFGEITFPICYCGMAGSPFLRISSTVSPSSSDFDRTLRIDRIFLVPKELDNYLKAHPDYKVHY